MSLVRVVSARPLLLAALLFMLHRGTATARADECPLIAGATAGLGQQVPAARLRFLAGRVHQAARRARLWSLAWTSSYVTVVSANLALVLFTDDPGLRIERYVSAASSTVGVASLILLPPRELRDDRELTQRMHREAPSCALLAAAERMVLLGAAQQRDSHGLLSRAGGWVFNLGTGALLGFAFGRWSAAAVNTVAGIMIGELMMRSRPTDLEADLRSYRAGRLSATQPGRLGLDSAVSVAAGASPDGGFALRATLAF